MVLLRGGGWLICGLSDGRVEVDDEPLELGVQEPLESAMTVSAWPENHEEMGERPTAVEVNFRARVDHDVILTILEAEQVTLWLEDTPLELYPSDSEALMRLHDWLTGSDEEQSGEDEGREAPVESEVDDVFAGYLPYQVRIRPIEGSHSGFELVGEKEIAWSRVIHGLDRMGVDIQSRDKQNGQIEVLVSRESKAIVAETAERVLKPVSKPIDEEIYDMPEDNVDERQAAIESIEIDDDVKPVRVFLKLQASGYASHIYFSEADGQDIKTPLAILFRENLVKLLK